MADTAELVLDKVENIFSQCFQRLLFQGCEIPVLFGKGLRPTLKTLVTLFQTFGKKYLLIEQCGSKIRLHRVFNLILIYTVC